MRTLVKRRLLGTSILALSSLIFLGIYLAIGAALGSPVHFSGWILFAMMILLATYNLRKNFPVPPLGSSAAWLQTHLYVAFGTVFVFFMHAGITPPTGFIESAIFFLYLGVAISGLIGLFVTRVFPSRMTSRGNELIFERFTQVLRDLRQKVEAIVEESVLASGTSTIANYYTERLHTYFSGPSNLVRHILNISPPLNRRMNEIRDQYRYLNKDEQKLMAEIARCVEVKDALDYQYAMQFVLKTWLFIHIPLTYTLLVYIVVHVTLVYAFSGHIG